MIESPRMRLAKKLLSDPASGPVPVPVAQSLRRSMGVIARNRNNLTPLKGDLGSRFFGDHSVASFDLPLGGQQPPSPEVLSVDGLDHESVAPEIAKRIEWEIKEGKNRSLDCSEILVPYDLTTKVAQDIMEMSESEPCGLRGCILYLNLEEKGVCTRFGEVKFGDRTTVATFEMYLNLRSRVSSGWINLISHKLLRNLARNSLVISDCYKLSKKKLYRSVTAT